MQTAQASPQALKHASLPASTTDAELVERAAKGDELAFERIMRKNNRLLFRTARSILKTDAEAEDALQEAYLRAWGALSTFRARLEALNLAGAHRYQRSSRATTPP